MSYSLCAFCSWAQFHWDWSHSRYFNIRSDFSQSERVPDHILWRVHVDMLRQHPLVPFNLLLSPFAVAELVAPSFVSPFQSWVVFVQWLCSWHWGEWFQYRRSTSTGIPDLCHSGFCSSTTPGTEPPPYHKWIESSQHVTNGWSAWLVILSVISFGLSWSATLGAQLVSSSKSLCPASTWSTYCKCLNFPMWILNSIRGSAQTHRNEQLWPQ